jgi:xanthine dehydrogenase molybdenum-binding subunit
MKMKDFSIIGKRIPKLDGMDKATGKASYVDDLKFPGMLYGKILRTKVPHAKILDIDTTRAKRLPGVKAVITADDIPMNKIGFGSDNPPLKHSKVCCIRDEIAAVAAVDESIAEEALDLIQVDYEELPTVFDAKEAIRPDAPLIHDDRKHNIFRKTAFQEGNVEKAFDASDEVVEDYFRLPLTNASPISTCAIIAHYDLSGRLTVWTPIQVPFLWQRDLALALGIPPGKIRVIQPTIGGGFGIRLDIYPFEPICAQLSMKTGKPVKLVYDREEELLAAPSRQPCLVHLKTGAKKDGTLLARDANYLLDCGAYISWGALTPMVMLATTSSLYRVPNVKFESLAVYTNNPYTGSVRGFGNPQSTFTVESQMDMLAYSLGIDPLEFRIKNAVQPGDVSPQGFQITSCGMTECLEKAAERSEFKKKRGKGNGRGIGLASAMTVVGGARIYRSDGCGSIVKIDDFGQVTLITGATEIGQGSDILLAQIVAEEIGVRVDDVQVINSDTDIKPWDVGTHASRATFITGNSAKIAAGKVKEKIKKLASQVFQERPEDIETADGKVFVKGSAEQTMPISRLIRADHFKESGNIIIAEHFYDPPTQMLDKNLRGNWSAAYGFCTHAVELEVDRDTGKVQILRIVCAHDVGRAINPMLVEGQMEGAISWGIGYALMEELKTEEGIILNKDMHDYKIPTVKDIPEIETIIVETIDPQGPFGAKGMGDFGLSSVAPAIANAIYDAVGVRIKELPMTPEKILAAIRSKKGRG